MSFHPKGSFDEKPSAYNSVRDLFGTEECVYVMDAKSAGNIGRFLNVSSNLFTEIVHAMTKSNENIRLTTVSSVVTA